MSCFLLTFFTIYFYGTSRYRLQVATWVVTPELFSTELRTMGHSSCTAVSRVGSFFTSFLVVSNLDFATIGVVLGLLNLVTALAAHLLPDTTGES